MIRNYLNIALRNIIKAPIYFIINLLGLSIGMGACFLIIQYVYFESNFDGFHRESENIYRIIQFSSDGGGADTPAPVSKLLKDEFEAIEYVTAVREARGVLESSHGKRFASKQSGMMFATEDFFKVFSFPIIEGDPKALSEPNKVFITEDIATKYFGKSNPIGKEMIIYEGNFGEIKLDVAGILKDAPNNTNIPFTILISMMTIEKNNNGRFWATFDNWGWFDFYTYVRLKPGKRITEEQTIAFLDKYITEEHRIGGGIRMELQRVDDIRLNATLANELSVVKDNNIINFLLIVAIFILTMACINYINLTTAKGFERAKEIGVRKNLGATRRNIVGQFSLEALIVNITALLVAITTVQLIQPFLAYGIGGAFSSSVWSTPGVLLMGMVPFTVGLIWSILQPAWLISSFSMVAILKGKVINHGKGLIYRKWSVIFQFTISLTLMVSSFIIYSQVRYLQNKDLGMNIDQLLVVERPMQAVDSYGDKAIVFKAKLNDYNLVSGVSLSGSVPAKGFNYALNGLRKKGEAIEENVENGVWITYVDDDYVDTYGIKMAAGVSRYEGNDTLKRAVINTAALKPLNFLTAEDAVGQTITGGRDEFLIIGVMENYNHSTVKTQYQPTLYRLESNANYITVKYNSGNDPLAATQQILREVEREYKSVFPENTFNYFFMDETFEENYKSEFNFGRIMLIFTGLAILLACLGLFGLSLFNLNRKTKEMGVRKVLGATSSSLLVYTSKDFIKLIALSALPALPLAFYLSDMWLAEYPFKVDMTWYAFAIPTVGLMAIALLTTMFHMFKLSNTNPIESLRYE
ncbi:MAG: ABC transporter permease [Bacteroidota bacterium]